MDGASFVSALFRWYGGNRRDLPWRRTRDPYAVWISEIMLQQTQVSTVIPYYERFLRRFPDVAALAGAPLDDVLKCWEGLGYYSRARHMHGAAKEVREKYGGKFPAEYGALRALPGLGDYTAAAVASIAFGVPEPVVDGNVWRVFSRILSIADPPAAGKKKVRAFLGTIIPPEDPSTFNQAIMELGALICSPRNPDCGACPARSFCSAHRAGKVGEFPPKAEKKVLPRQEWACLAVQRGGDVLVRRRPLEGLWGGLWELPTACIEGEESARSAAARIAASFGLTGPDAKLTRLRPVKHTFTHFKLTLHPFLVRAESVLLTGECRWAGAAEPAVAMPVPHAKVIQAIVSLRSPSSFSAESAR